MDNIESNYIRDFLETPAHDSNFLWAIIRANEATISAALEQLKDKPNNKTKIRALESRLRVLQREKKNK